jgi:uncharacterized protein (DUF427 family)
MKAIWDGVILAESDQTVVVEGNHYFPPESLHRKYFKDSSQHTECGWKGTASYYDIEVNGKVNLGAAWYYPAPKPAASNITGYIAFWKGIEIIS